MSWHLFQLVKSNLIILGALILIIIIFFNLTRLTFRQKQNTVIFNVNHRDQVMIAFECLIYRRYVLVVGQVLRVRLCAIGIFLNLQQIWGALQILGLHFTKVRKIF